SPHHRLHVPPPADVVVCGHVVEDGVEFVSLAVHRSVLPYSSLRSREVGIPPPVTSAQGCRGGGRRERTGSVARAARPGATQPRRENGSPASHVRGPGGRCCADRNAPTWPVWGDIGGWSSQGRGEKSLSYNGQIPSVAALSRSVGIDARRSNSPGCRPRSAST